jgi:nitrate reductase NapAB chaperone NapD
MTISALLVACAPEHLEEVAARVAGLGWAEVRHRDPAGRLVVTLEARDADESLERFGRIQALPQVLSAALAAVCAEEESTPAPDPGLCDRRIDGPDAT